MNNLPRVVVRIMPRSESNPRPLDHESNAYRYTTGTPRLLELLLIVNLHLVHTLTNSRRRSLDGSKYSEASRVDLVAGIHHHSGHSTAPMFSPAPYTVHHPGWHPQLPITSVSSSLNTSQVLGSLLDVINPLQQFLFSRKQVFSHLPSMPTSPQPY